MRRLSYAVFVLAGASALALFTLSASAGPPGKWTQITHAHNGSRSNLGLARGKDGALHVLWAGPNRPTYTAIYDTPISPKGAVGKPNAVVSGWLSLNPPAAATAGDGSIHAMISGQKVNSTTDPFAGLNEAVGPGTWKLGAKAFGSFSITVPSNADVGVGVLANGQTATVWRTGPSMLFQVGVTPSTMPQDITTAKDLGLSPVIAVDGKTGEAIIAYVGVTTGSAFFRRVFPSLGPPQAMPQSKADPTIAARSGGGVYSAYAVAGNKVRLLRFGGGSKSVPVPKGARVLTAGVAPGPEGRLWIFYGDEQKTYVTRTSKAVRGFEPVQTMKSPPKTVQYFRLEGEGSAGPLDLFADVTVTGTRRTARTTSKCSRRSRCEPSRRAEERRRARDRPGDGRRGSDPGRDGERASRRPEADRRDGSVAVTVPATSGAPGRFAGKKAGYVAAKGRVTI